jgi:hypothetical protein
MSNAFTPKKSTITANYDAKSWDVVHEIVMLTMCKHATAKITHTWVEGAGTVFASQGVDEYAPLLLEDAKRLLNCIARHDSGVLFIVCCDLTAEADLLNLTNFTLSETNPKQNTAWERN